MEILAAYKAEQLLSKYVNVSRSILSQNIDQALNFAKYPSALKLISKQALHKTEIKGVRIVHNKQDLIKQYGELLRTALNHTLHIEGILVQDYKEGSELFVGIKKDPTFGHAIGLGIGGILVEDIKDVQWRICPIKDKDVQSMLENLKFKHIITGTRGQKNNIKGLKKALINLSNIPRKYPHLKEMDVNPLILNDKQAVVVDARMPVGLVAIITGADESAA